ncbi:MAG: A/G-specific adenine glycosylase [Chloroflexi bacterium HGW-Chloroflexi-10]|nr:MAG: A/G-specific adenine glycosylase [Chloroflexi bacterium HGW-Chloroflexi-10]
MRSDISHALLAWYAKNARQLPWRDHPDPYAVWVSEIMLQQTRVETVISYFHKWMERFPDIDTLANSQEQDVLKIWEGLGYYSRARNLHKAARIIQQQYHSALPAERTALEKLPGIGKYTAAAITSMAFGQDQATLDGNIRRVLARIFNVEIPARSPQGELRLWTLAEENLPPGRAGDYNQAWMDLGASICLPKKPQCTICPLKPYCLAFHLGVQNDRPVLPKKQPTPHFTVTAAIIHRDQCVLIAQRPPNGLLGGLWEFPGGKCEPGETLPQALTREIREELGCEVEVGAEFGIYQHAYTHFRITLHAFHCWLVKGEPQALEASQLIWAQFHELESYPMGKIDRSIAKNLNQNNPASL